MPISKKKLLLLNVNREGWHSGNMIYDMMVVQRAFETRCYGPGWPEYRTTDLREIISQIYGNEKPDVIYSYFTPGERVRDVYQKHYKIPEKLMNFPTHLEDIDVMKIFALSDFWARSPSVFSRDLKDSSFRYCFCCFTPPYSNPSDFYSFFDDNIRKNIKFIAMPRCVDSNCFKDYGLPKKHDVISVGAMYISFYPLRTHMHMFLQGHSNKLGINYKNYAHCGSDFHHSDFVREKYASAINESKILISCGGKYHLAFNKIFEAMACNTLYIGEKPYGEEELHLRDGHNYVSVTKDNFVEKILYYLNSPEETKKITDGALETFSKYHNIDARVKDFSDSILKIL